MFSLGLDAIYLRDKITHYTFSPLPPSSDLHKALKMLHYTQVQSEQVYCVCQVHPELDTLV